MPAGTDVPLNGKGKMTAAQEEKARLLVSASSGRA